MAAPAYRWNCLRSDIGGPAAATGSGSGGCPSAGESPENPAASSSGELVWPGGSGTARVSK